MFFGYDPLGRCVKRLVGPHVNNNAPPADTNPATYFYYDGWNLIQEGPNGSVAERTYVHGNRVDEIVASVAAGAGWLYHHYDARGHCILQTNASGGLQEQYDYDAFGWPYFYTATGAPAFSYGRPGSPSGNRFLFTGREWIKHLRLYDYRARMYQPELGRFLQPDPTGFSGGDFNLYRYCDNDPVNKSDPMGLISLLHQGGGDWIKGSDGLSAWDREHGMPSNRAGPDGGGGGGNDNAELYRAVDGFKNRLRQDSIAGIGSEEIVNTAFDDGREAGRETAKDLRSDSMGRYNIEHASSEYPAGNHLDKDGPVRGANSRYSPHANLPYRTDGTHRVIGSHGHGIQSEKGLAREDIRVANGRHGTPFVASLGHAGDRGHRVIIYVPTGGGRGLFFHSTDRRNFYSGE
jgi:RHS repeat-associated protein